MAADPDFDRRGRLVVIGQAAIVALLVVAALAVAASAQGVPKQRSTIGRTWPIAEPDALAEIEAKVASLPPDLSKAFGPRSNWTALRAASLAVASENQVRAVVPFYTLDVDITLPDGKTLYPKGYSFNPLAYVRLPQRLVIVHANDLAWALKTARRSDFILLTAREGDKAQDRGDPISLSERTGRAIYILEERVKDRLGLTAAPVIVAQAGQKLILTEFGPKVRSAGNGS
jgi:conjugal transfer pilus assembly protein TraW